MKQLSVKEAWKSTSSRWSGKDKYSSVGGGSIEGCEASLSQMEGFSMYGNEDNNGVVMGKIGIKLKYRGAEDMKFED